MVGLCNPDNEVKDGAIRTCLDLREEARAAKDYANADFIRDMFRDAGFEIKDRQGIWWSTRDERHGQLPIEGAPPGSGGCTIERGPRLAAAGGSGGGPHRDERPRSRSPPRGHGGGGGQFYR